MLASEARANLTRFQKIAELPNGIQVLCNKVPGFRLEAFQRSHQPPPPPRKEVEGFKGVKMMEEDPTDPNYLSEMASYEERTAYNFMNIALDHMVLLDEDAAQAAKRAWQLKEWGLKSDERTRIETFALGDPDDALVAGYVKILSDTIMGLSTATAPGVAQAEESFPPEVEQRADPETGDANEPSGV